MALILTLVLHCLATTVLSDSSTEVSPRLRILHPDNPFRENLAANISHADVKARLEAINDPKPSRTTKKGPKVLEYRLNNPKDKSLAKRVAPSSPFNALIASKDCLFCEGKARRDSTMSVARDFMADQLIAKMIIFATVGDCMFCKCYDAEISLDVTYSVM